MHTDTLLVHAGRSSAKSAQAVNPPLVRASTIVFETLADYNHAHHETVFDTLRYGRSGTITTFELQRAMASLAGTQACIATGSGLAAIVAVLSAYGGPGKHILLSDGVYGPTRIFCERELRALGTDVEFFPAQTAIAPHIRDTTSLIYIETPASLTMEMLDVGAVCAAARVRGVPVAADATWGTPVFFDAHGLGINVAIHAATKYIGGHSDLVLGLITGSMDDLATVRCYCDRNGTHASPEVCWLALRGLRTLALRLQRHQASAMTLARWLHQQPQVKRVLFPALESDPGHALWRQQFSGAPGPFTIELVSCTEAIFATFLQSLKLFSLGVSWGGFESLVLPAVPYHLRSLPAQADEGRHVRIHVGLEDVHDLRADLAAALRLLN
jgi:cysteine-S-conjugate beta-lyase